MGKTAKSASTKESNQETSTSEPMKLPRVRKLYFKPSHVAGVVIVFLLAVFLARVAIWEYCYFQRMEGTERAVAENNDQAAPEDVDKNEPTETEVAEYVVAPDRPRYLTIPSIGLSNARILELGLRADGELSTPYNLWNVGWYNQSALPGSNKVVVMDAHGGAPGVGAFGSLPQIRYGDKIRVEMGDGRVFTYSVVETATKALGDEANNYMVTAFESPERGRGSLTLITCTGVWWMSSQTYSHRFFVRALLES